MKRTPESQLKLSLGTWLVDRINVFFHARRTIKMLTRRWWLLLVGAVAGGGVATVLALRAPDIYRATSRIGIAPKIQTAYTSQAQYLEELNNFYDSQIQYMTSSRVMSQVEERVRPYRPTTAGLVVMPQASKGPGCFNMSVESTDFEFARRYAITWAQAFIAFKNELRESAIGRSAASTREEIQRYEVSLQNARSNLLAFQRRHNIGSIKETGDAAQQRLDKLEAEYQDLRTLRMRLESKTSEEIATAGRMETLEPAEGPGSGAAPERPAGGVTGVVDPLAKFDSGSRYSEIRLQLKNKRAEWQRRQLTLKRAHPYMRKLALDLEQLLSQLSDQLELIEEKRLARINSLRVDEESYRPLIEELRNRVLSSRNVQYEFERLQEEEGNLKTVLANLRKAEESLNSTTSEEGLFTVIEEGLGAPVPIRPDRARMILAGLVLGLGLALGLVYLLDRLDDRLELAEEIEEALGIPVLGQLPQLGGDQLSTGRALVTRLEDHNLFAESLRSVRSAVLLGDPGRPKQVLLMTSAVPGDGKTTFSVNFAITLAIAGNRVLLVDADLRRGDTHSFFGHSREPGFSEVLLGQQHWSDVLHRTEVKTLQVLHSGQLPANPGELLISPITREFVEEVKQAYDYVLFDCPPVTTIDDSFALVGLTDGLIFVVRSAQTSMRFAKAALDGVQKRGVPILGFVLNGIKADNPHYYYKHYYYSYYTERQPRPPGLETIAGMARTMARPKQAGGSAVVDAVPPAPSTPPEPEGAQIVSLGSFPGPDAEDEPDRRTGSG